MYDAGVTRAWGGCGFMVCGCGAGAGLDLKFHAGAGWVRVEVSEMVRVRGGCGFTYAGAGRAWVQFFGPR